MSCSVDVSFAPFAPEDRPDFLLRALGIGVGLEGQRFGGASLPQSQALQDSRGGHLTVQSVDMNTCKIKGGVTGAFTYFSSICVLSLSINWAPLGSK